MEVLVIWTCLGILLQFHGFLCDVQAVDFENISGARIKRNHENDNENTILKPLLNILKPAPKIVKKSKPPIIEQKESKNVTDVNHILQEIASLVHNNNETKDIQKIRHLVDEIDKQNKIKNKEPKVTILKFDKHGKEADSSNKNPVKTKIIVINRPKNTTKSVESTDELTKNSKINSKITSEGCIETKETEATDGRRSNIKICENSYQKIPDNYLLKKENAKNENLIEIKEHAYEEELLHTIPSRYAQTKTYNNLYSGRNYYPSYAYRYNTKGNNFNNSYNTYPFNYPNLNQYSYNNSRNNYRSYNINGFNYAIIKGNTQNLDNNVNGWERNVDITGIRKTWLDRNTIIRPNAPYRYPMKTVNENRKVITNIQRPDYNKYYSATQKLYPGGVTSRNQSPCCNDPCHCS